MRYRAIEYGFDCAATHGDETRLIVVRGPAEAADPLGADLVEEDRVDVDRKAIGGGVYHAIHKHALLQVDCQLLQVQIFRLLCSLSGPKRALLGSDLGGEGFVFPVNLEEALGAGGLLRGDDPAVLNRCLVRVRVGVGVRVVGLGLELGLGLGLGLGLESS